MRSLTLANARYNGGLVTYLDVITAQEQLLSNQRLEAQLQGQRLVTSVLLGKALGGGWDSSRLSAAGVNPGIRRSCSSNLAILICAIAKSSEKGRFRHHG